MMPKECIYECEIIWKDIISRNDWNLIKESLRFQEERKSNIRTSIQKEKQTNQVQISQINRSIQTMEMSLIF
jgi:HlyD family secretion protein